MSTRAGAGRATRASANAANAAETPQGQHSVLLRKLLTEKLTRDARSGEATRMRIDTLTSEDY